MKVVAFKVFGYTWLVFVLLLIIAGYYGVWMKEGFSAVQALLSPFNLINWLTTLITLAPGVGALMWAEKLNRG